MRVKMAGTNAHSVKFRENEKEHVLKCWSKHIRHKIKITQEKTKKFIKHRDITKNKTMTDQNKKLVYRK